MRVTDAVQFLAAFAPTALDDLRSRHPEFTALLQPKGETLGPAEDAVALDAMQVALTQMEPVALQAITLTTKRLRITRRVELFGTLAALISSGGVIGATIGLRSIAGAALLGGVGFVSSAIPLLLTWLRGVPTGEGTVADNFVKLRESVFNANLLQQRIRSLAPGESPSDLIQQGNELAHIMFVALTNLGFEASLQAP